MTNDKPAPREWTLVVRGSAENSETWYWEVLGPKAKEFHDDVSVIEYSAYEEAMQGDKLWYANWVAANHELNETRTRLRDLAAKAEKLVKALKKYADPETHSMDKSGFVWSGDYFDYETAQKALKEWDPNG